MGYSFIDLKPTDQNTGKVFIIIILLIIIIIIITVLYIYDLLPRTFHNYTHNDM